MKRSQPCILWKLGIWNLEIWKFGNIEGGHQHLRLRAGAALAPFSRHPCRPPFARCFSQRGCGGRLVSRPPKCESALTHSESCFGTAHYVWHARRVCRVTTNEVRLQPPNSATEAKRMHTQNHASRTKRKHIQNCGHPKPAVTEWDEAETYPKPAGTELETYPMHVPT